MKLADRIAGERRLAILRLLALGNHSSDVMIAAALKEPQDVVRIELAWLAENGLVTLHAVGGLSMASLSQRGFETAAGIVNTPGVRQPQRRERLSR